MKIHHKIIILFIISLFLGLTTNAQSEADSTIFDNSDSLKLIQLSGVIISDNDLNALPYATVFDKNAMRGVMSDYYGYFSFVTHPGDTLYFSYYGYKTSTFIVPDTLTENRYSIIHVMLKDTVNLPEVTVYPWPSREEFARAFVEMNVTDDAVRRAQRELSGESLAFIAARVQTDASLSQAYARNQMYTQIYSRGQIPGNNILNPYAWSKLISDWKAGKLKRQ
ncbi:MAG TPA: carboxypeptidase-like regulatory domain-containing protein [Taishania sp.]|nr:carboxypeptidase-like regulatory domain-containing protein [Taishania sp.]